MRRNDHDVTNRILTTDPAIVKAEIQRLYKGLYDGAPPKAIERAFTDIEKLYRGEHLEYYACDTVYHDLQHVLEVTLAMARLMDGYERSRRNGTPRLPPELFMLGVLAALFHDFGYLRRRSDRRHRHGAEYTRVHVSRSAAYLRHYMRRLGAGRLADIAAKLLHYTGYERPVEQIRVADGSELAIAQEDVKFLGHAIECRINAENPVSFRPSPGKILHYHPPGGLGVRVDSAVYQGYTIPPYYDSPVGKLIVHGRNRNECLMRLRRALDELVVGGIETTIPLFQHLVREPDILNGDYHIHWLEHWLAARGS